jgi:hypothetical protein
MLRAAGTFVPTGKSISENLELPRKISVTSGDEDNVESIIRRAPKPRTMKGDERTIAITFRKLRAAIEQQPVRRPVCGEYYERCRNLLASI